MILYQIISDRSKILFQYLKNIWNGENKTVFVGVNLKKNISHLNQSFVFLIIIYDYIVQLLVYKLSLYKKKSISNLEKYKDKLTQRVFF